MHMCTLYIYICIYIGASHVALVLKKTNKQINKQKKTFLLIQETVRDAASISGLGRSLEEEMQPSPVFLPGKFNGQRRLAGYSP